MKFSEELVWRESLKDKTFTDVSYLDTPHSVYLGVDGTATSLTIGNLAILILLMRFVQAGYKVYMLIGGATTMIGDPSDKLEERKLKSADEIKLNTESIKKQVQHIFDMNVQGENVTFVNNYDWFKDIRVLDFLRDAGKMFSISELLGRDFVQQRIDENGKGISYAEFSYTLIQGYDYWYLNNKYGVELQIGGSDQWVNLLSGVSLIRKKENTEVDALTIPLIINRATGVKFGKSQAGAIWLDETKTSPTMFYQFFINTIDEDLEYLLKAYTFLDKDTIESVIIDHKQNPSSRLGQKTLAYEVTKVVHGTKNAELAIKISDILTGKLPISQISDEDRENLKKEITYSKLENNFSLVDLLVNSGLASSKTESRKLLKAGSISINFKKFENEFLQSNDFIDGYLLVKKGKAFKDSALISLSQ